MVQNTQMHNENYDIMHLVWEEKNEDEEHRSRKTKVDIVSASSQITQFLIHEKRHHEITITLREGMTQAHLPTQNILKKILPSPSKNKKWSVIDDKSISR